MKRGSIRLLSHIVRRKMIYHLKRNIAHSALIFVTVFAIYCFLLTAFGMNALARELSSISLDSATAMDSLTLDSIRSFLKEILKKLVIISVSASLLSSVTFCISVRVRAEEEKHFDAILLSVGATRSQMRTLSLFESVFLYFLPIFSSAFLAILPASLIVNYVANAFSLGTVVIPFFPFALILAMLICLLVILIISLKIPSRKSVISQIKRHNDSEVSKEHSYRKSYTFKSKPIEERIAKKSVEYYSYAYYRIGVMFAVCALYPILAVFFLIMLSSVRVEIYPSAVIDVEAIVSKVVDFIIFFTIAAFILLLSFAVFQLSRMIKAQNRVRRDTLILYKSIGMTDDGANRVLKYEYLSIASRAVIILIFVVTTLIFVFSSI